MYVSLKLSTFILPVVFFSECFYFGYASLPAHSDRGHHVHRCNHFLHEKYATIDESRVTLAFILIAGILFFLILLGLLKGLVGLCVAPVGAYGLDLLIDLPRPLERYQERAIAHVPVIYDVGGWPIHPHTHKRSVRILPRRTEFCLNIIFFLSYPIAAVIYLCGLLCCIKNYKSDDDMTCFKKINVVRVSDEPPGDIYRGDCDCKEEQDTNYVRACMRESKESIEDGCGCK